MLVTSIGGTCEALAADVIGSAGRQHRHVEVAVISGNGVQLNLRDSGCCSRITTILFRVWAVVNRVSLQSPFGGTA